MKELSIELLEKDIAELIAAKGTYLASGNKDAQVVYTLDKLIDECSRKRLRKRRKAAQPARNIFSPPHSPDNLEIMIAL
jgi:hypothetical protein